MVNWALVIGINKYQRLQSLSYAVRDAELMRDYFNEACFERVFYFADNSPEIRAPDGSYQSTAPTSANLFSFLHDFFVEPCLSHGDNFWFFFSGHGMRDQGRDYLMSSDANPRLLERTAISTQYITERLRECGADNVILFLDACRNEGDKSKSGLGIGGESHQGVITIASCSPTEKSYEIEELRQGAFTYALLEALRIQGENNCATVERLYQRLTYRVPKINQEYEKPEQIPYAIIEPASKYHLILLPKQATDNDIATLREDAKDAEIKGNLKLAEQLWTRILVLSPANPKVIDALKRIWKKQEQLSEFNSLLGDFEMINEVIESTIQLSQKLELCKVKDSEGNELLVLNREGYEEEIFQLHERFSEICKTIISRLKFSDFDSQYNYCISLLETISSYVMMARQGSRITEEIWRKLFDRELRTQYQSLRTFCFNRMKMIGD